MLKNLIIVIAFCCLNVKAISQQTTYLSTGKIEYLDAGLAKIILPNTKLEIIASGFLHVEGPVWVADSSMLLFSDTKAATIYKWKENNGITKFLAQAGFTGRLPYSEEPGSNGLALTKSGDLLIAEHGDRRIAGFPLNALYGRRTLIDNYKGKRFNSPNDIVVKTDGSVYFTDPPYGLPKKERDSLRETKFSGVYLFKPDGSIKLLIENLPFPNGLAFSPDEKFLYVSNSDEQNFFINRYQVKPDGTLGNGKLFYRPTPLSNAMPKQVTDGLKVDKQGNIWTSGPGGLLIISPDGKLLGRILTDEIISNCTINEDTIFLTAGSFVYRLKINQK